MKKLVELNRQYEDIIHSNRSKNQKDKELANLMSKMEQIFNIPAIKNHEWEEENKAVIALYRIISRSRSSI
jgi:hypothetical protein